MGLSLTTGEWLLEVHDKDFVLIIIAHLAYGVAGILVMFRLLDETRWAVMTGGIVGAAAGMTAMVVVLVGEIDPYAGPATALALEIFLLVAHALYIIVNLGFIVVGFNIPHAKTPPPPLLQSNVRPPPTAAKGLGGGQGGANHTRRAKRR